MSIAPINQTVPKIPTAAKVSDQELFDTQKSPWAGRTRRKDMEGTWIREGDHRDDGEVGGLG